MVLGLVTGNIEEGARIKLLPTGLWPHFRVGAYGSDHMDRRRLPSLATRRAHALVGHAFAPTEVVVIGDTPHDIDCARAFGAVAIAVTTGQYTRAELSPTAGPVRRPGDVEVLAAVLAGAAAGPGPRACALRFFEGDPHRGPDMPPHPQSRRRGPGQPAVLRPGA